MDEAEARDEDTDEKQRLFGEFAYAADTWDRPRRVIAKAEFGPQGDNPRFIVTSLAGDPQDLYDRLYCQRGEAENRIKEQQLGLFADRTSCHAFCANQFRVLLSAAAYVLVETLRREALAGTELASAQVGTIRLKLLKIGGRIVRSVRVGWCCTWPRRSRSRSCSGRFSCADVKPPPRPPSARGGASRQPVPDAHPSRAARGGKGVPVPAPPCRPSSPSRPPPPASDRPSRTTHEICGLTKCH